jgi:eukaryotic-like serine/threonine-protein kinase
MAMGTNRPPNNPNDSPTEDSSDRKPSAGGPVSAAAGQIGPYRLLQLLGEGGMGEVWLAEQKIPIHRTVALKLIKTGMDTKAVVARFESERQALALMDHPNIARVFDAGSTPEGRPYFVMEYVPGLPLTEYCDKRRLTLKERLEIFIQVCDGVQHAHQKAVIHRDLKPSNVLVVEQDNKAVPKIIDFGLAKATGQRLTDKTMFTQLGVMMGTPEYMSPEQADQREQNIDTRTDVYSLGVILYLLLAGVLPFETKALRASGLEDVLRAIREQEPLKPSTRIRSLGPDTAASAEKRKEEPRSFARHLQGELDWITMKALEKDRARRYGSPAELAADIAHYLRHEPVLAHPPSAGYRASKFVRRHRFGVAAAASAVVLLIAFAAAMAIQARRIARERDRANRQAEAEQRVAEFMTNMFKVSDPSEARGNTITAREILDKASKDIENQLTKDPELQAQMMGVMGRVYLELGLFSRAQALLQRAWDIRTRDLGPGNPETLKDATELAWTLMREGQYTQAEKVGREALDTSRHALGPEHPITIGLMIDLTFILSEEGRFAEAETIGQETVNIANRVLGPEAPNTLAAMSNLASVLSREGRYDESEKINRELLEVRRRVLGPEHPDTLIIMNNLATDLEEEGKYSEAEEINRETLDIRRRVLGPEHPLTLSSMSNLADVLGDDGKYPEAERIDRETLEIRNRVLGPENPDTLTSMDNLAYVLYHEDRYAEAEKLASQAADIRRRVLGPDHPETALSTYTLACIALRRGQRDKALSMLRQSVDHGLAPNTALAMEKDPDLQSLHGDPRFAAIVEDAKQRAAGTQKSRSGTGAAQQ